MAQPHLRQEKRDRDYHRASNENRQIENISPLVGTNL